MADQKAHAGLQNFDTGQDLQELLHDNGDGTFARTAWVGATITATIGTLQITDGQDVAEGATTDTAIQGDNAGSVNAHLRGLTMLGGANTDVAVSGDTAGTLAAKARGLNKTIGNIGDAAWSGSGNASLIALQKALYARLGAFYTRADTFTTPAAGVVVDMTASPGMTYSLQVVGTGGAATAWSVVLEGSLDNANWTTILTHVGGVQADGSFVHAAATPALYLRTRLVSVTLSPASALVATLLAKA